MSQLSADPNIQMSVAHAQNVKCTKCMQRLLIFPDKERCWTHGKDVEVCPRVRTQKCIRRHTCGEETSQTKQETRKILRRQGKIHCMTKSILTGGRRGKKNDDPQRLKKVDWTESVLETCWSFRPLPMHTAVGASPGWGARGFRNILEFRPLLASVGLGWGQRF